MSQHSNIIDRGKAHDWWHSDRMMAEDLMREIERLHTLVMAAYIEGFSEGINQMVLKNGGKNWGDSKVRNEVLR